MPGWLYNEKSLLKLNIVCIDVRSYCLFNVCPASVIQGHCVGATKIQGHVRILVHEYHWAECLMMYL